MWHFITLLETYLPIIDSKKLDFLSSSTVYEYNNGYIIVAISPGMTSTSKRIDVKYHWFRQHTWKEFMIWKTNSENQKANIFSKGLQSELFVNIRRFLWGWQESRQEGVYQEMESSDLNGNIIVRTGILWTIEEW